MNLFLETLFLNLTLIQLNNLSYLKECNQKKDIINQAHDDEITKYPEFLQLISFSESCKNEIMISKDERILVFQGHPEYSSAGMNQDYHQKYQHYNKLLRKLKEYIRKNRIPSIQKYVQNFLKLKNDYENDTHSKFVDVQDGDVLIHCGDFTNWGHEQEIKDFISWLKAQPHKHKIVVPGNHDISLDVLKYPKLKKQFHRYSNFNPEQLIQDLKDCCHLLINSSVTIEGFKFWGSPYTQEFGDWAFQIEGSSQQFWDQIEEGSDVIITHGPPYYYGDRISNGSRVGDKNLVEKVKLIKPKLHVFGGIHESYGVYEEIGGYLDNQIKFVNCSIMDQQFKIQNKPYIYNLIKNQ